MKSSDIEYWSCPRITGNSRPKTSADHVAKKPMVLKENTSMDSYAVPQPNRSYSTLKHIQQRSIDISKDDKGTDMFAVRRIKANFDPAKGHVEQYTTPVNQPQSGDLFHLTEIPGNSKHERPLKYETWKHKNLTSQGPIRHYIQIPSIPRFADSRDKSAEAYRHYLENSRSKHTDTYREKKNLEKENSELSMYGYQNRMLQSVIDVNAPSKPKDHNSAQPIEEQKVVENVELNGGEQNEAKRPEDADNNGDTSRSNKSIVVEIKATWNETQEDIAEQHSNATTNIVPPDSSLADEGIDMDEGM